MKKIIISLVIAIFGSYQLYAQGLRSGGLGGSTGQTTASGVSPGILPAGGWSFGSGSTWTTNGGTLVISTATSATTTNQPAIFIDLSGNIGIGVKTPARKLEVLNNDNTNVPQIEIGNGNSGTNADAGILIETQSNSWTLGVDKSISDGFSLSNGTSLGTPKTFVTTTGEMAIGNDTSPDAQLEIIPDAADAFSFIISSQANGTTIFSVDGRDGLYYPNSQTSAAIAAIVPLAVGGYIYNSTKGALCTSSATTVGAFFISSNAAFGCR